MTHTCEFVTHTWIVGCHHTFHDGCGSPLLICRIRGSFNNTPYTWVSWVVLCDMTHLYVTRLAYTLRLAGSFKLQVFFAEYRLFYRAFLSRVAHISLYVRHDSFTCAIGLLCVTCLRYERGIYQVWKRIYLGRVRLVGSFKLKVSFAEYRVFYGALLQKRPMILRSLLVAATPCQIWKRHVT